MKPVRAIIQYILVMPAEMYWSLPVIAIRFFAKIMFRIDTPVLTSTSFCPVIIAVLGS
jgi:hypothetical protein